MLSVVRPQCFTALDRSDTVTHMLLPDMFRFVLNTFKGEEALLGQEVHPFWNPIINKGSKVEDLRLRQLGDAQYLSRNQLLRHHVVENVGRLIYGIGRADLNVWIEWLLAFCGLTEHGSRLLLIASDRRSLLCVRNAC